MGISTLGLEDKFESLANGSILTLKADIIVLCPGATICKSVIYGQTFITDVKVDLSQQTASFINVRLERIGGKVWLLSTDDTITIQRPQLTLDGLANIVEACSGIGAVGQGFKTCGANTIAFCDYNAKFCEWLERRTDKPVIQGNIAHIKTVCQIDSAIGQQSHVLHGGVACQPFSKLGDERQGNDIRSESFVGLLNAGYHLGSLMIIMECTPSAMTSQWGQEQLKKFTETTGYNVCQFVIDLSSCWPSKRQRWWAVLTHPQLPCTEIPPMPSINWEATVFHLLPRMMDLTHEELEQLTLDLYELRHFHDAPGGISRSVFNPHKVMPTATHSWGSQVKNCHCQCRASGFSEARLAAKGLYGVLIPLGKVVTNGNNTYHQMRHPHPLEVALLNGMLPKAAAVKQSETLRLALAGVGQLASPLQSAWIYGNYMWSLRKAGIDINIDHPRNIFADFCRDLLKARDELLGHPIKTRYMRIFEQAIDAIDTPNIQQSPEDTDEHVGLTQAIHQKCIELETKGVTNDVVEVASDFPHTGKGKGGNIQKCPPKHTSSLSESHDDSSRTSIQTVKRSREEVCNSTSMQSSSHGKRPAFTNTGGVVGFETSKKTKTFQDRNAPQDLAPIEISPTIQWEAEVPKTEEGEAISGRALGNDGGFTTRDSAEREPNLLDEGTRPGTIKTEPFQPNPFDEGTRPGAPKTEPFQPNFVDAETKSICVRIGHSFEKLHNVKCHSSATVGQIAVAESKIQQIAPPTLAKTPVGSHLSASSCAYDEQIIVLHDGQFAEDDKCPEIKHMQPPNIQGVPREQALWYQKGWVATDEMTFYLNSLNHHEHSFTTAPIVIPDRPDASIVFSSWILRAFDIAAAADKEYTTCTACLWKKHWIPIYLQITEHETSITTTVENQHLVRNLVHSTFPDFAIHTQVSQQAFPADCGFQTFAWIQNRMSEKFGTEACQYPMQPDTAVGLRKAFADHLFVTRQATQIVKGLQLGGMGDHTIHKLQQLLESHGVSQQRSESCAQNLVKELGISSIQKTLASPEPWRDLKTKASAHQPPIKIVLTEELKAIIDEKIAAGHQFGRKNNKKQGHQNNNQWKGLSATQVHIPVNVFKQEDGKILEQTTVQQFHQQAAGVAVVNIRDALPFFSLDRHLSQEGLGLLILDHQDSRIPECKEIIRFPATCPETDEPMLVTAALLQLGKKKIHRNMPDTCTTVEEIRTLVVRALVYKDQFKGQPWSTFVSSPVKHLMLQPEFREQPEQTVLDVWDRQYINKQFQRTKPNDADIFVVAIRITESASSDILAASGTEGVYYEPRTDSGRSPLPTHGVVWMPRKQLGEVMLAKQTSQFPTWIVRSGDRYGLRVEEKHIPDLHKLHRPDIEYLEGQTMAMYRVGPLPYGTTKQSLQKVFKEWSWKARAGQPQGQDTHGVMWTAQATEPPSHWVFTMGHGDVLITKLHSPKDKPSPLTSAPLTSHRTMQHLTAVSNKKPWEKQQHDPWTNDDPWLHATSKAGTGISPAQLSTIETNVEKRILAQLPTNVKPDDMEMEPDVDHRVSQLESQVQQLKETVQQASASMQSFQHQQAQQNHHEDPTMRLEHLYLQTRRFYIKPSRM